MYIKTSELRDRDVINTLDGRFLGNVCDVDLDPKTGALRALVVETGKGRFPWFKRDDLEIRWQDVILVGIDAILVKLPPHKTSSHPSWNP